MIINNFKQIQSLLIFDDKRDWFYHLSILLRKKDMPEAARGRNNNARCIKTYYITSVDYLIEKEDEIIKLCENFGARAYINLNAKSFEKVAFEFNKQLADRLQYKQFEHCYRLYETVVGGGYDEDVEDPLNPNVKDDSSKVNVGQKRWIIDVDEPEIDVLMTDFIEYHCDPISDCVKEYGILPTIYSKIIAAIPTKSGWHLITKPFNMQQFKTKFPAVDLQKNNPTVLYFNHKEI
jgi:hypothetical protein